MKKLFVVFTILTMLFGFDFAKTCVAQQNAAPPLLMQQSPPQAPLPVVAGQGPAVPGQTPPPPAPPNTPPLPGPGIPIVQTIPAQMLLASLPRAVGTVQKLDKLLGAGKVWIMRGPGGEIEIKAGLLYQGVVVGVLRFNPADGTLLPLGINPHAYQSNIQLQEIKARLSSVIEKLRILQAAEFMEPEASWSFPVAMGNSIVARLKVYYTGTHIVQDFAGNQEMILYGQ